MSIPLRDRERRCIFRECDTDTSEPSRWCYLTLAIKKQLSQARQEFDVHDDVDGHDDLVLFICARHRDKLDKIIFKNGARSEKCSVTCRLRLSHSKSEINSRRSSAIQCNPRRFAYNCSSHVPWIWCSPTYFD